MQFFAILKSGVEVYSGLSEKVIAKVQQEIGKFVTPKEVYFVDKLPKTRSGKIMRRLLKAVVEEQPIGDVSTLEDASSVEDIKATYQKMQGIVRQASL